MYRRPFIARRPATAIMIRCSWPVQLSDEGALELLAYNIHRETRAGGELKREVREAAGNRGSGREGTRGWGGKMGGWGGRGLGRVQCKAVPRIRRGLLPVFAILL